MAEASVEEGWTSATTLSKNSSSEDSGSEGSSSEGFSSEELASNSGSEVDVGTINHEHMTESLLDAAEAQSGDKLSGKPAPDANLGAADMIEEAPMERVFEDSEYESSSETSDLLKNKAPEDHRDNDENGPEHSAEDQVSASNSDDDKSVNYGADNASTATIFGGSKHTKMRFDNYSPRLASRIIQGLHGDIEAHETVKRHLNKLYDKAAHKCRVKEATIQHLKGKLLAQKQKTKKLKRKLKAGRRAAGKISAALD
ncbi:hypothetical protein E8E12_002044 [Didymella heteroderae]|uniref:Uncharacterized protein n=1 Tax=Didymella heteroderae TaxID=1769908 RepID=A0A9P4WL46_9PLEO|nr:hypothetical protein E8E12_002044 [Didymella heteroderae]